MAHGPRGAKWNASGLRTWRACGLATENTSAGLRRTFEGAPDLPGCEVSEMARTVRPSSALCGGLIYCFVPRLANLCLLCETPDKEVVELRVVPETSGKAESGTVSVRKRQRNGLLLPTDPPSGPCPSLLHVTRQTRGASGSILPRHPQTRHPRPRIQRLWGVHSLSVHPCLASPQRGPAGGRLTAVSPRQACH